MDFKIAIMDEQFENGQSGFGEIKLHRFEKKKDQKFQHNDVVYGDYYSEEYSFVRLAVHECDPMTLAALRK